LTEYSNLLEAEAEETEMPVVMVKTVKMAKVTETTAAVMTMVAVMVKTVAVTVKTVAVTVKTVAVTVKTVAVTVKTVATVKTAKTAEATELAAAVMTMAEKAAADITDRKGSSRWHIRGNAGL
jgi:mediator of RNA polymerase II transcription subunit 4